MEVFNESGTGSKKHVGKGKLNMKSAIPHFEVYSNVEFQLSHISGTKETKKGKLLMRCKIEGPPGTSVGADASLSAAQSQPVKPKEKPPTLQTSPATTLPSQTPEEQKPLNSIDIKPTTAISLSKESQPPVLPPNKLQDPQQPIKSSDTKPANEIPSSGKPQQVVASNAQEKASLTESKDKNYEVRMFVMIKLCMFCKLVPVCM